MKLLYLVILFAQVANTTNKTGAKEPLSNTSSTDSNITANTTGAVNETDVAANDTKPF